MFFVPTLNICRSILFVFPKPICSLMTTFVCIYHSSSIAFPLGGPSNLAKMASRSFFSYIVFFFYATFDSKRIWLGTNKTLSPPQTFGNFLSAMPSFDIHTINAPLVTQPPNFSSSCIFFAFFFTFAFVVSLHSKVILLHLICIFLWLSKFFFNRASFLEYPHLRLMM
jgi:hypothetical protein